MVKYLQKYLSSRQFLEKLHQFSIKLPQKYLFWLEFSVYHCSSAPVFQSTLQWVNLFISIYILSIKHLLVLDKLSYLHLFIKYFSERNILDNIVHSNCWKNVINKVKKVDPKPLIPKLKSIPFNFLFTLHFKQLFFIPQLHRISEGLSPHLIGGGHGSMVGVEPKNFRPK